MPVNEIEVLVLLVLVAVVWVDEEIVKVVDEVDSEVVELLLVVVLVEDEVEELVVEEPESAAKNRTMQSSGQHIGRSL